MVYRFIIKSEDQARFLREIEIDADASFLALRNAILDSVGYSKDEMDSFFICDSDWERREEITLEDMGSDSDQDTWLMEDTHINEFVEEQGQKMVFMYDYITGRVFNVELRSIVPHKTLMDPVCTRKEGKVPPQLMDLDEFDRKRDANLAAAAADIEADNFDEEIYGGAQYNEEELPEGFEEFS